MKQRIKVVALILLAVVSLSFAAVALTTQPGSSEAPGVLKQLKREGPKLP